MGRWPSNGAEGGRVPRARDKESGSARFAIFRADGDADAALECDDAVQTWSKVPVAVHLDGKCNGKGFMAAIGSNFKLVRLRPCAGSINFRRLGLLESQASRQPDTMSCL